MAKIENNSGVYSFTDVDGKVRKSKNESHIQYLFKKSYGKNAVATAADVATESEFSINERFEFIENYVSMVAEKIQPSVILTGSGGIGKTYTVNKSLKAEGFFDVSNLESFVEGQALPRKHYRVIKGYSTAKALYRILFENKDSVLILDDCDSVFKDADAANVLKSALDSSDERIVCWNAESRGDEDLPRSFRYTGGVIFISNLTKDKIPQALRTRAVCVDVSMKLEEKIERMKHILEDSEFMPETEIGIKRAALKIIDQYKAQAREVSMRTLIQVIRIGQKFTGEKFAKMSRYALTCGG
jgi:hypothetical protein